MTFTTPQWPLPSLQSLSLLSCPPFLESFWQSRIFFPSSLLQAIAGVGLPFARQVRATLMPSVASVSELLSSSMMSGGTENLKLLKLEQFNWVHDVFSNHLKCKKTLKVATVVYVLDKNKYDFYFCQLTFPLNLKVSWINGMILI